MHTRIVRQVRSCLHYTAVMACRWCTASKVALQVYVGQLANYNGDLVVVRVRVCMVLAVVVAMVVLCQGAAAHAHFPQQMQLQSASRSGKLAAST